MLKTSLINLIDAIKQSVIVVQLINIRKVESREARLFEDSHVGIIRHALVYFVHEAAGDWMRSRVGELLNDPAIVLACLKHEGRAAIAAAFEIKHQPDIPGPGMLIDKGF